MGRARKGGKLGEEEKGENMGGPGGGGEAGLACGEGAGEEEGCGGDTPTPGAELGNREELNIRAGGEEETAMREALE